MPLDDVPPAWQLEGLDHHSDSIEGCREHVRPLTIPSEWFVRATMRLARGAISRRTVSRADASARQHMLDSWLLYGVRETS